MSRVAQELNELRAQDQQKRLIADGGKVKKEDKVKEHKVGSQRGSDLKSKSGSQRGYDSAKRKSELKQKSENRSGFGSSKNKNGSKSTRGKKRKSGSKTSSQTDE